MSEGDHGPFVEYPGKAKDSAALRAEIERTCDQWRAAMMSGDMKKVAAFYADDGVILDGDGRRVEGREAIDDYWSMVPPVLDWKLTTHFVDGVEGLIVQRGRSELTMQGSDQEHVSIVEFTHVWRRQQDGSLEIVVDAYWRGD